MPRTQLFGTGAFLLAISMVGPAQAATRDLCSALKTIASAGSTYLVNSRTGLIAVVPPPDLSHQSGLVQLFGPRETETRYGTNLRLPGSFICWEILSQERNEPGHNFLRCSWLVGFNNGPKIVRDLVTSVGQCWPKPRRVAYYSHGNDSDFSDGNIYVVKSGLEIKIHFKKGEGDARMEVIPGN